MRAGDLDRSVHDMELSDLYGGVESPPRMMGGQRTTRQPDPPSKPHDPGALREGLLGRITTLESEFSVLAGYPSLLIAPAPTGDDSVEHPPLIDFLPIIATFQMQRDEISALRRGLKDLMQQATGHGAQLTKLHGRISVRPKVPELPTDHQETLLQALGHLRKLSFPPSPYEPLPGLPSIHSVYAGCVILKHSLALRRSTDTPSDLYVLVIRASLDALRDMGSAQLPVPTVLYVPPEPLGLLHLGVLRAVQERYNGTIFSPDLPHSQLLPQGRLRMLVSRTRGPFDLTTLGIRFAALTSLGLRALTRDLNDLYLHVFLALSQFGPALSQATVLVSLTRPGSKAKAPLNQSLYEPELKQTMVEAEDLLYTKRPAASPFVEQLIYLQVGLPHLVYGICLQVDVIRKVHTFHRIDTWEELSAGRVADLCAGEP
ncbi:hypothetical protein GMRT_14147 [Giardia muris]|uniref:Uncharacterized protein n=1 Tax=Giardia muris TaxID=5742 RepID=A0A4Z1SMX2_GIAMU|nr:hypothetical protein GMRT_14147 [Giardia muris]|eukprot:TNJ27064.1 hypothetical protein GMRT_14147 [Giardia muris]